MRRSSLGVWMMHKEQDDAAAARAVARHEIDAWIASSTRLSAAREHLAPDAAPRTEVLSRVEAILVHPRPRSANRRWICELLRAWAPLEILFPTRDYRGTTGISGELPLHVSLLVEREYGHVLSIAHNLPAAFELLRADRSRLGLQLAVAAGLQDVFRDEGIPPQEDADWLANLRQISLTMAEYLHRQAIGLAAVIPDTLVMHYTAQIARTQRLLHEECLARGIVEGIEIQAIA